MLSVIILLLTIVLEFYSYAGSPKYSIDCDGWNDYFMSVVILINFLTGEYLLSVDRSYLVFSAWYTGKNVHECSRRGS